MTLGEYRQAKEEDRCYVVQIKKHKTFTTYGPVHLVLSFSLHQWMKIFISKFRNVVANERTDDTAPVFLTWSNRKMHASHLGCQIGSCWGKVFGNEAGAGGATAFQKAAVSAVHKNDKGRREKLARFMVHQKAVADRYYLSDEKATTAVTTSKYLTKVMHGQQCSPKKKKSKQLRSTSREFGNESSPPTSDQWTPPTRRKWAPEEEPAIKDLFSADIAIRPWQWTTWEKLQPSTHYAKLNHAFPVEHSWQSSVVFLKAWNLCCHHCLLRLHTSDLSELGSRQQRHTEAGHESGSEYSPSLVPPSTSTSKKTAQKLFTEEYKIFKEMFKDLIESKMSISWKYVQGKLEDEPKLCHLVQKYTGLQLADKVRTERRILARNSARKCKSTLIYRYKSCHRQGTLHGVSKKTLEINLLLLFQCRITMLTPVVRKHAQSN